MGFRPALIGTIGSLALLLNTNANSQDLKGIAERHFNAIREGNFEAFESSSTNNYKAAMGDINSYFRKMRAHFGNSTVKIEKYIPIATIIPEERRDFVWAGHEGCGYHAVQVAFDFDYRYKIESVSEEKIYPIR